MLSSCDLLRYQRTRAGRHRRARSIRLADSTRCQAKDYSESQPRPAWVDRLCANKVAREPSLHRHLIYPARNNLAPRRRVKDSRKLDHPPCLYLTNPTCLVKPHALQHLDADIWSYDPEVVIIVELESWFKQDRSDEQNGHCRWCLDSILKEICCSPEYVVILARDFIQLSSVRILNMGFTEAFNTVRHSSLSEHLAG